jgi:hypothetical protein
MIGMATIGTGAIIMIVGFLITYQTTDVTDTKSILRQMNEVSGLSKKTAEDLGRRMNEISGQSANIVDTCGQVMSEQTTKIYADLAKLKTENELLLRHFNHIDKKLIAKRRHVTLHIENPLPIEVTNEKSLLKRAGIK